ncbi:BTAD domain-containing putative transcriptional regulator [Micromonospora siamensis]|uniref:DNA-binding transcriptional activator of the SARP family n=1 Tax=Micromonospora siamensis TaxID=299152 RepID=A0A1C5K731_9ACTN|nr:BTAD domain-containing putative transcriptional regulator [Micromonospora siamensis]SCG78588.1 DNA-binding transcriptional activator of the SARP family [Micromonospora siamensis]
MSEALRFQLLGPQRAWYADRHLDLGPGKQRAVLTVLLLSAGRAVPTGQIVEAVWPDDPPANGANVVQKYVAGLRRVLEPERSPRTPGQVLTLTDAGYRLNVPPEAVDAIRFERGVHRARQRHAAGRPDEALAGLTATLELWQGEPFAGYAGPYFEIARHRLVELRAVALETRAELELTAGRHRELVGELVEAVAEFPVRERLRHQLMLALYRGGRQAEALAAYRDFAGLLREEHGIEPGEALRDLHGRILRSDPTLVAAVPAGPSAPAGPSPVPAAPLARPAGPPAPATDPAVQPAPAPPPIPFAPATDRAVPAAPATDRAVPATDPAVLPAPAVHPAVQSTPAAHPAAGRPPAGAPVDLPIGVPAPPYPPTGRPTPRWLPAVATVVGTASCLFSVGFLTWAVVLAYALWRRSWRLALAGSGYLLLIVGLIVVALTSPATPESDPPDREVLFFVVVIGICWVVGTTHVVLLNPTLTAMVGKLFGADQRRAADERRARREHARYLLHRYPTARTDLRIGRPDLPRTFDDGGLVDVNAVPDHVLAGLPGLTDGQRRLIVADRRQHGPYGSVEELGARCGLPANVTGRLRDVLIFLPSWQGPT